MNEFGFVDYKKPLGQEDDMRTSTYRGHVHMTDTMLGNKMNAKFAEKKNYHQDHLLSKWRFISENKSNYTWKYCDPNEIRNPSLDNGIKFIKPYDECQLRFIKRPIRPATSVSHDDFVWKIEAPEEPPLPIQIPSAVEATTVVIDRCKPGFAKYLDPSATTSRLDYTAYTPAYLMGSVAAKDNITFWNWPTIRTTQQKVFPEKDEEMCNKSAAKDCPKRRCEFPSLVKAVPNTGMTTEVRDNYLEPLRRAIDLDTTHIRNNLIHYPIVPSAKDTEYKLYGSGERTQKYI